MPNNLMEMFVKLSPMYSQFLANPISFLASNNLNIPWQYMSSPQAAVNYLIQSKGLTQQDINNVMQSTTQFQNFMNNQNGGNNHA